MMNSIRFIGAKRYIKNPTTEIVYILPPINMIQPITTKYYAPQPRNN